MKNFIRLSLISGLLLNGSAFAVNPIPGLYGGIIGSISHGPSNYTRTFSGTIPSTAQNFLLNGTVNYNFVGGGGGAALGYRIQNFRVEGEVFYNYIGTSTFTVGNCTLESPIVTTPSGRCPTYIQSAGLGFNGSTTALFGLVNGYFDFSFNQEEDNPLAPYIGLGIGGATQKSSVNFVNTFQMTSVGGNVKSNSVAGQVIIGASYFMDDYAWIGVDFRYLSTGTLKNQSAKFHSQDLVNFKGQNTSRYVVESINFTVNGSFDNSSS